MLMIFSCWHNYYYLHNYFTMSCEKLKMNGSWLEPGHFGALGDPSGIARKVSSVWLNFSDRKSTSIFYSLFCTHSCVGLGGGGLGRRGRWGSPPPAGVLSLAPTTEGWQQRIRKRRLHRQHLKNRKSDAALLIWILWPESFFQHNRTTEIDLEWYRWMMENWMKEVTFLTEITNCHP